MIDLKISEMEKKEEAMPESVLDTSNYPYGLRINLDPKTMQKLNMGIPSVGQKMKLICEAEVISVYAENKRGDEREICSGLQITAMEVAKKEAEIPAAAAIYGE